MTPKVEELVARLRPRAVFDVAVDGAIRALRGEGLAMMASSLNEWLVANNALKSEAADSLTTLSARVMELEAALRPFAEVAERIAAENPGWDHDEFHLLMAGSAPLKLAPYRRARAALQPNPINEAAT